MSYNDTLSRLGTEPSTINLDDYKSHQKRVDSNHESPLTLLMIDKTADVKDVASTRISNKVVTLIADEPAFKKLHTLVQIHHLNKIQREENLNLESLKKQNFLNLVEYLENGHCYLFNEITELQTPQVMELLFHLNDTLEKKKPTIQDIQIHEIMHYAIQLARENENDTESITSKIGKLLFLVDREPLQFVNEFENLKNASLNNLIEDTFDFHIKKCTANIDEIYQEYKRVYIQNPEVVSSMLVVERVANFLITSNGQINFGIIPSLIDAFIKKQVQPLNYEINLLYGLNQIKKSPLCRYRFSQIELPAKHNEASFNMIKIMLNIKDGTPVEKIDAQRVILSAMLSHLRQNPTGTCFAESLAIELLSSQIEQCLEDFIKIVKDGSLTRTVSGKLLEFPYIFSNEKNNYTIEIGSKGLILNIEHRAYLYESPSLIRVCAAIGVSDPKDFLKKFVAYYYKENGAESTLITISQLLQKIVNFKWGMSKDISRSYLLKIAEFAYEAQISNGLLKLWRNAIAGMAEAQETSMIKSSIKASTLHALNVDFIGLTVKQNVWLASFYRQVEKLLSETIQLQYDPRISRDEQVSGAFVLYDKNNKAHVTDWIRIDSAELFRILMFDILRRAYLKTTPLTYYFYKQKTSKVILNRLLEFVRDDKFIYRLLRHYHFTNYDIQNIQDVKGVNYSPWVTKCGNNSSKVIEVYLEKNHAITSDSFSPKSAKDLLLKIVQIGKSLSSKEKIAYKKNPNKLIPVKLKDVHSFSLMLGHISLFEVFGDSIDVDEWIKTHLENPAKKISNTAIDDKTLEKFLVICKTKFVKEKDYLNFLNELKIDSTTTYREIRTLIVTKINQIYPLEKQKCNERTATIDSEFTKALPKNLFNILKQSSIHFADTNWNFGIHDVHFCFILNPFSGRIELWEVCDNGSTFKALAQEYWLREWEFSNPNQLLPENESLHIR